MPTGTSIHLSIDPSRTRQFRAVAAYSVRRLGLGRRLAIPTGPAIPSRD